jgi:cytochrome c biogenesis protein CcmG/thiol:disulfide interchange protein DsbE
VSLVNVWASWCGPCRDEHPFIEQLAADDRFQVLGINHTDQTAGALGFLDEFGNPYDAVGVDPRARVAIDWGVYGVPETFLVDRSGVIRYKIIGPIDQERLENEVMPQLEALLAEAPGAVPVRQ